MNNHHLLAEAERLRTALAASGQTRQWRNLVEMFFEQARARGDAPFLFHATDGGWRSISWREAARTVAALAQALRAQGVQLGDRVALISEGRPEFCLWDLAIMATGAISVPTYTTNTVQDHLHILEDSGAIVAIVSTAKLAAPLLDAMQQSAYCRLLIGMETLAFSPEQPGPVRVAEMAALLAAHPADDAAVAEVAAQADMPRRQLACIIYTSGTGGSPRGVMQHHGAILHNLTGCLEIIEQDFPAADGPERFLSFLPPSHAYEHTAGQFFPIATGGEIHYAEGLDRLSANIAAVQPSLMVVVPRLFEVLRQRITREINKTAQGRFLLAQALRLAARRRDNGAISLLDRPMDMLLRKTLRQRIIAGFGGRLRALVSGGAPLNPEVGLFFEAVGLTVLQGYGQTEAGPVVSCNRPAYGIKTHTVGPPLRDTEIRIAEDGEILVAGELVMLGYWRNDAETANALREGWLHTGDIGCFDEDGHLIITDRKKDMIVSDKGESISPQRVEGVLNLQEEIAQSMVAGDNQPHLVALLVPEAELLERLGTDPTALRHSLQTAVDRANAELPVPLRIRRFLIADEPFSIANEQMTPSLKPRRHILREVYGERLDALYR